MLAYTLGSSGWLALVFVTATAILPYLLRPTRLGRALGLARQTGALAVRFRPHLVLGVAISVLALVHTWAAMSLPAHVLLRLNRPGLILATIALVMIFGQLFVGVRLLERGLGAGRAAMRRWHFWGMGILIATAFAHVVLNSALLHAALRL